MDVAEAKRALRREARERRRAIPVEARLAAGRAVGDRLLALPELRAAPRVALYAATAEELPTRSVFEALGAHGCRRLLPRIRGDALEFAIVEAWSELRPGRFGVLAPTADRPAERPGPGDVVLLPGLAFDRSGRRLGRGGGYYDRTFPVAGPFLVGLAFHVQLVDCVPCDSRDRRVDAIVTERELCRASEVG